MTTTTGSRPFQSAPESALEKSIRDIKESDYPPTFRASDRMAVEAQQKHLRYLLAYILVGLVGVSMAQLLFNWMEHVFWVWCMVVCVAVLVGTRIIVVRRRAREREWFHSRATAEQIRSLCWKFMMRVDSVGDPQEEVHRLEGQIVAIRDNWLSRLHRQGVEHEPEVTSRMQAVRALPSPQRRTIYQQNRLTDQLDWYARKARANLRRNTWFFYVSIGCEMVAMILICFIAWQLRKTWGKEAISQVKEYLRYLGPALAGAGATLAWTGSRRYKELADTYTQTARQLSSISKEMIFCQDDQRFAALVRECEELLTRENSIWFTRRNA